MKPRLTQPARSSSPAAAPTAAPVAAPAATPATVPAVRPALRATATSAAPAATPAAATATTPAQVSPAVALRELSVYLNELQDLLQRMLRTAAGKIAAMRRADAGALHELSLGEADLVKLVFQTQQRRAALLARLAQSLHCPELKSAGLTELAAHLPEPLASSLRARNAALRATALELQEKNRLVAAVACSLQEHIRGVFAEVAKAVQDSLGYGPQGRPATGSSRRCCMDAVG